MTSESFVYWLQGFVELQDSDVLSEKQWKIIKDHLKLVFEKKTPDRNFTQIPPTTIGPTPIVDTFPKIGVGPTFVPPYRFTC